MRKGDSAYTKIKMPTSEPSETMSERKTTKEWSVHTGYARRYERTAVYVLCVCVCWMLAIFNDMEWFLERIQQYLAITFFILSRSFCRFWGFASIWACVSECLLSASVSHKCALSFPLYLLESNWICSCFVEICDFRMTTSHARCTFKAKDFPIQCIHFSVVFPASWCAHSIHFSRHSMWESHILQCSRQNSLSLTLSLCSNRCVERL